MFLHLAQILKQFWRGEKIAQAKLQVFLTPENITQVSIVKQT